MVSAREIETAPPNPELFYTNKLRDIYKGLLSEKHGAPQQLVEFIGYPDYYSPSSYIDVGYKLEKANAIRLLPMIEPQESLPIIRNILERGLKVRVLQLTISAAAQAASEINSPQVAELVPLINLHLANLGKEDTEWMDKEDSTNLEIPRSNVVQSLDQARTSALWRAAGRAKDSLGIVLPLTRRGESFLILHANPQTRSIICFDLEGPLSGLDCAYEVFKLIPEGEQMFRAISYYDDMICGLIPGKKEWRRENYEAGDTLQLILPHLVHHGISENDIRQVSAKATLVPGVKELFGALGDEGWEINIVSTSYAHHAYNIGGQLGLTENDIYCTQLPLDNMVGSYSAEASTLISAFERDLKGFSPDDFGTAKDEELKAFLDRFYWKDLPQTKLGEATGSITVVGGARKAWAVERIARNVNAFIEQMAFVGDSITDSQAAKVVEAMRGLMIAFNGNDFVIPFATIGLATTNMSHLKPALDVWRGNGRTGLREWITNYSEPQGEFDTRFDWIPDANDNHIQQVIETHRRFREELRKDAASLG